MHSVKTILLAAALSTLAFACAAPLDETDSSGDAISGGDSSDKRFSPKSGIYDSEDGVFVVQEDTVSFVSDTTRKGRECTNATMKPLSGKAGAELVSKKSSDCTATLKAGKKADEIVVSTGGKVSEVYKLRKDDALVGSYSMVGNTGGERLKLEITSSSSKSLAVKLPASFCVAHTTGTTSQEFTLTREADEGTATASFEARRTTLAKGCEDASYLEAKTLRSGGKFVVQVLAKFPGEDDEIITFERLP